MPTLRAPAKRSLTHLALALALIAPAGAAAQAGTYSLASPAPPTYALTLFPGTWTLETTSGAWNAWGNTTGCDVFGANCTTGWLTAFHYQIDGGGWQTVGFSGLWATPQLAEANSAPPVSLVLPNAALLELTIRDSFYSDNRGTLDVAVAQVTTTPEPASVVLMATVLLATAVGTRARRRLQGSAG